MLDGKSVSKMISLVCRDCHVEKPMTDFYPVKGTSGRKPYCRACRSIRSRKWHQRTRDIRLPKLRAWKAQNPEYARTARIRAYGISREEYEHLHKSQDGRCKICKRAEEDSPKGRLAIDHDHATGRVRALLCNLCNIAIGALSEDPHLIRKAAEYLEDHSCVEKSKEAN